MAKSYKESLNNFKDIKNIPLSENDKVSFKKPVIKHRKEWVLEYHYKSNNSAFKWLHGWHRKNSYISEERAEQALVQLKTKNDLYDDFRIYNINKKPSSYE